MVMVNYFSIKKHSFCIAQCISEIQTDHLTVILWLLLWLQALSSCFHKENWDFTRKYHSCHYTDTVFALFSHSHSLSIWSEWDSDGPVLQALGSTDPEADRGLEAVLSHRPQHQRGHRRQDGWPRLGGRFLSRRWSRCR